VPKAMHSGPPGGPLAIPPTVGRVMGCLVEFGDFFHFWNFFSNPSGGPICTRGAPIPLPYDTLD